MTNQVPPTSAWVARAAPALAAITGAARQLLAKPIAMQMKTAGNAKSSPRRLGSRTKLPSYLPRALPSTQAGQSVRPAPA